MVLIKTRLPDSRFNTKMFLQEVAQLCRLGLTTVIERYLRCANHCKPHKKAWAWGWFWLNDVKLCHLKVSCFLPLATRTWILGMSASFAKISTNGMALRQVQSTRQREQRVWGRFAKEKGQMPSYQHGKQCKFLGPWIDWRHSEVQRRAETVRC